METFNEKLFYKILKDNIVWKLAGHENDYKDGNISKEELKEILTFENAMNITNYEMTQAYKKGYLESDMDNIAIEAKHLKFMGTGKIEYIKVLACKNALKQFKK